MEDLELRPHEKDTMGFSVSNGGTRKCNPLFRKLSQLLKYHTVRDSDSGANL